MWSVLDAVFARAPSRRHFQALWQVLDLSVCKNKTWLSRFLAKSPRPQLSGSLLVCIYLLHDLQWWGALVGSPRLLFLFRASLVAFSGCEVVGSPRRFVHRLIFLRSDELKWWAVVCCDQTSCISLRYIFDSSSSAEISLCENVGCTEDYRAPRGCRGIQALTSIPGSASLFFLL